MGFPSLVSELSTQWELCPACVGGARGDLCPRGPFHRRGDIAAEMCAGTRGQVMARVLGARPRATAGEAVTGDLAERHCGTFWNKQGPSLPVLFQARVHYSSQTDVINETSHFMQ